MASINSLPPVPIGSPTDSYVWQDYQIRLQQYLTTSTVLWANLDKTGSNLTDIATRLHSSLQSLQGGTAGEYYHITSAQATNVANLPTFTAIAKPTITGSRGGNVALANLLTALANYNLITDSTTA